MNCCDYWNDACADLRARDSVLAELIERHSEDRLRGSGDALRTLLNAVTGQQISVAAAESIWNRLLALAPNFDAAELLALSPEELRAAGLSRRKIEYIQGIAGAFDQGVIDPDRWRAMSDQDVRDELVSLRGIGPWTADMMLIFYLHRPDILPLGDIGLINGATRLYGWDPSGSMRERTSLLQDHAELWRPWRTVATWYIWRDIDAEPVVY